MTRQQKEPSHAGEFNRFEERSSSARDDDDDDNQIMFAIAVYPRGQQKEPSHFGTAQPIGRTVQWRSGRRTTTTIKSCSQMGYTPVAVYLNAANRRSHLIRDSSTDPKNGPVALGTMMTTIKSCLRSPSIPETNRRSHPITGQLNRSEERSSGARDDDGDDDNQIMFADGIYTSRCLSQCGQQKEPSHTRQLNRSEERSSGIGDDDDNNQIMFAIAVYLRDQQKEPSHFGTAQPIRRTVQWRSGRRRTTIKSSPFADGIYTSRCLSQCGQQKEPSHYETAQPIRRTVQWHWGRR